MLRLHTWIFINISIVTSMFCLKETCLGGIMSVNGFKGIIKITQTRKL
jgi:hypothetical protein